MFHSRIQLAFHLCHTYLHDESDARSSSHNRDGASTNGSIFAPFLYKNESIDLSQLCQLLHKHLQNHILPLRKHITLYNNHSSYALRTYLHQQYDETTCSVPQLFLSNTIRPMSYTVNVQYVATATHTSTFTIHVPSMSENHIRYTLANGLHQTTDVLSLFVYEKEQRVRCILDNTNVIPLHVVFLNIEGARLAHTSIKLKLDVSIALTRFAIVHHPSVRRWLYTQTEEYTYITLFIHTQLFAMSSLSRYTQLRPNDTLYCIMTTQQQKTRMHRQIGTWVDTLHCSYNAKLKYMYLIRNRLYTGNYNSIPYIHTYRLSYFHQHLWLLWVHQLAFLYKLFHLRKTQQLKRWLNLHCTLLANSLWNDYAYHTNRVFDNCAKQALLYETQKWKYMVDHWDVICLALAKPQMLHTITHEYQRTHTYNTATAATFRI